MRRIIDIPDELFAKLIEYGEPLPVGNGFHDTLLRSIARSIPYEDKWIPVKERLPEEDGVYLVTLEYVEDSEIVNEIDMAKFVYSEKDDCNDGFHKAYTVIAWKPLPEVYMEGL